MADVTVTAGDVRPLPGYLSQRFDAGGTIYTGQSVYIAADGNVEQSDCDAGSLEAQSIGIMVADNTGATIATSGDRVDVVMFGPVTGYSSMTPGALVFASTTAGALVQGTPSAGSHVVPVGMAINANTIFINPSRPTPYVVKA